VIVVQSRDRQNVEVGDARGTKVAAMRSDSRGFAQFAHPQPFHSRLIQTLPYPRTSIATTGSVIPGCLRGAGSASKKQKLFDDGLCPRPNHHKWGAGWVGDARTRRPYMPAIFLTNAAPCRRRSLRRPQLFNT